jgi:VWFA-related protein
VQRKRNLLIIADEKLVRFLHVSPPGEPPMNARSVRTGSWAVATAVLAATSALAQQPAAAPVTESVQVHVVNVEAVATGKDGKPVLDLGPGEFQLLEDGRLVRLTNFLGPEKAPEAGASATASAATPVAGIAPPSAEAQQRTLIVFLDDLNLTRLTRTLVLERLGGFMDAQLRNGYREVLLAFDLSLRHITPVTVDRAAVASGIKALRKRVNEGQMARIQRDRILGDMARGAAVDGGRVQEFARAGLRDEAGMFGMELYTLERRMLEALRGVVDAFSGMPGRKALLLVSDGVPVEPAGELAAEAGARFGAAGGAVDPSASQDLRLRLDEVARHANAGRITFYTITVPPPGGGMSAEARGMSAANVEALETFNREQSLTGFTVATGGQKLYNPDMLARMATDMETVYSLGYSPSHFGDGAYHSISVKVTRPGVSVRCREGYLDKTAEQRQADRTTAALLAGGDGNPLGARLALGASVAEGRKKLSVPLTVTIPAANLTLLPSGGFDEGKVTITIAVAKVNGSSSEVHRESFPIKVPAAALPSFLTQDTTFTFTLLVNRGDTRVSVTARDETAQVDSVVVADLVPSPGRT